MEETLESVLEKALSKSRDLQPTREASLVITKIQEAQMWNVEFQRIMTQKIKEHTKGSRVHER